MVRTYEEYEEKFDVGDGWAMPVLADLVPAEGRLVQGTRRLESTYHDTAGAGLRVFGITLRRRVGGDETGWQLKVPQGTSRTEIQSGSRSKSLPRALADAVQGLLAGEPLVPVAVLQTTRTTYRILDNAGQLVLEIADDAVKARPAEGELPARTWRQIEAELGPAGSAKVAKQARKLLRAAGAEPSESRNKLDQALGEIPAAPTEGGHGAGSNTVGELVGDYVGTQCEVMVCNDVALRTDINVVHKTRVAARRLRSTLRVFAELFDEAAAAELDQELSWYADLLGKVRDLDVLGVRLAERVADLPAAYVRGPVAEEISRTLLEERERAFRGLGSGMNGKRYAHLVRLLRSWRAAPPFTAAAAADRGEVATYIARAKDKADKRLRKAGDVVEELHRARKAMKRVRYAAELGGQSGVARKAKQLQTQLGDHQDSTVSARYLSTLARSTESPGSAFTYGFLVADELATAARIRAEVSR